MAALFRPTALLKVGNDRAPGEAPNDTFACTTPLLLYRTTASPPVLRPTPPPM